jgi:hypothetical protein
LKKLVKPSRPGERRGGRKKGTPNATTRDLRNAILLAAENVGRPEWAKGKNGKPKLVKGAGGLVGYLEHLALTNTTSFSGLLGRVLPTRMEAEGTVTLEQLILRARASMEARERAALTIEGELAESPPAVISGPANDG